MSKIVAAGKLEEPHLSLWKRIVSIPSLSFSASLVVHTLGLCVLALIVIRLPSPVQSYGIDFTSRVEQPVELVDTGFPDAEISDAVAPGFESADLQLDSSSAIELSLQPGNPSQAVGAGKSGSGGDGLHGEPLPEPVAKLVTSRGGRVLKGQQRGVSATLQWNGHDDLDLYMELGSEKCFFNHMKSKSLELDVDANFAEVVDDPVENIVTRSGSRPRGSYRISVHHYESRNRDAVRPFTVFVVADGICRTFKGKVEPNEMKLICEFEGSDPFSTEERIAESKWLTVRTALKRGQNDSAVELLRDLATNYSGTPFSKKAKDLLKANGAAVD